MPFEPNEFDAKIERRGNPKVNELFHDSSKFKCSRKNLIVMIAAINISTIRIATHSLGYFTIIFFLINAMLFKLKKLQPNDVDDRKLERESYERTLKTFFTNSNPVTKLSRQQNNNHRVVFSSFINYDRNWTP